MTMFSHPVKALREDKNTRVASTDPEVPPPPLLAPFTAKPPSPGNVGWITLPGDVLGLVAEYLLRNLRDYRWLSTVSRTTRKTISSITRDDDAQVWSRMLAWHEPTLYYCICSAPPSERPTWRERLVSCFAAHEKAFRLNKGSRGLRYRLIGDSIYDLQTETVDEDDSDLDNEDSFPPSPNGDKIYQIEVTMKPVIDRWSRRF
mmetsp:Transcript_26032/g.58354  ORF Transcript_26032/g.58354 Transcript_26032/m.58354 type:complete len:203 (-) Transcript_26032:310-918(-)